MYLNNFPNGYEEFIPHYVFQCYIRHYRYDVGKVISRSLLFHYSNQLVAPIQCNTYYIILTMEQSVYQFNMSNEVLSANVW